MQYTYALTLYQDYFAHSGRCLSIRSTKVFQRFYFSDRLFSVPDRRARSTKPGSSFRGNI